MTTKETPIPDAPSGDMLYKLPPSAMSELAYAMPKYLVEAQEPELRAEAKIAHDASKQSALDAVRADAITEVMRSIRDPYALAKAISQISTARTQSEIQRAVDQAVMKDGLADSQQQSPEQQLLNDLHAYDKKSAEARNEMEAAGYKDTPENKQKLKELNEKLGHYPEGSPEWLETRKQILGIDIDYFAKKEQEAGKDGNTHIQQLAHDRKEDAQKLFDSMVVERQDKDKGEKVEVHANVAQKATYTNSLNDDDSPPAEKINKPTVAEVHVNNNKPDAQLVVNSQGLLVKHDVTMDDVSSQNIGQSSGKEPSRGK